MEIKKSPIYYMGNKFELLKQLYKHFPNKIDTFYDIFGGSGTVAINFLGIANEVVYNEFNPWVYKLFNYYRITDPRELARQTKEIAEKYGLPYNVGTAYMFDEQTQLEHKQNYERMCAELFADDKVRTKLFYHHLIKQYSFCNMLNYDAGGFKKESWGNRYYKETIMTRNHYHLYDKPHLTALNHSFEFFINREYKPDDFLYFDPPYWNTGANYNEGWTFEHEQKLLQFLTNLTAKGIKWALSNVFEHKGKVNAHLQKFVADNGYYVFYPKQEYSMNGATAVDNQTVEVFITNYDPVKYGDLTEQLSLF